MLPTLRRRAGIEHGRRNDTKSSLTDLGRSTGVGGSGDGRQVVSGVGALKFIVVLAYAAGAVLPRL